MSRMGITAKAIPVTGRGGQLGCETSRLPLFLDNLFTDGGELSALRAGRTFIPRNIPGTHFCWRLSRLWCHNAAGRIRSIEKSSDLIGNGTRYLPTCASTNYATACPAAGGFYAK
jgi:hypothetical protein